MIQIIDVPDGGNAWHIYRAAAEAGYPVGIWEAQQTPYIPLPASYEDLLGGLSQKLRANLRRRRKRLEEMGEISIERIEGGAELNRYLEEGFRIEQSGW